MLVNHAEGRRRDVLAKDPNALTASGLVSLVATWVEMARTVAGSGGESNLLSQMVQLEAHQRKRYGHRHCLSLLGLICFVALVP